MSYVMVARWRPREGATKQIETILRELAAAIRQEPGNLHFTALRGRDDANEFLLYEGMLRMRRSVNINRPSTSRNLCSNVPCRCWPCANGMPIPSPTTFEAFLVGGAEIN